MKRFLTLLLTFAILFGLIACQSVDNVAEDTASDAAADTEDTTALQEEPVTPVVSVCGHDLSEYTAVAYFRSDSDAAIATFVKNFDRICTDAFGFTIPYTVVSGSSALADAVKENDGKVIAFTPFIKKLGDFPNLDGETACYGVTESGGIYVTTAQTLMYSHLFRAFLYETLGVTWEPVVPAKSAALSAFQREADLFSDEMLSAMGYGLVFDDEFDGDTLSDAWERLGHPDPNQRRVSNGILELRSEYLTDGERGETWYTGSIWLKEQYCRGYFEARLKCHEPMKDGFWSAFWIQGPEPYNPEASLGGIGEGGCEIDILEYFGGSAIQANLYCSGGEDVTSNELDAKHMIYPYNGDEPFSADFHTFGLLWDEDCYILQLDGVPYFCTNFCKGTSHVPERVIFDLAANMNTLNPDQKNHPSVMQVDYMKIWQKAE